MTVAVASLLERRFLTPGTFGVKKPFHGMAMKIGPPVFKPMAAAQAAFIASDCQLAGHHIGQGIERSGRVNTPLAHPLTLLRKAYDT